MTDIKKYIDSGILELYVLGQCSADEALAIEQLALSHQEIRKELADISESLEAYAMAEAISPSPVIKPFLLATIDYTQRLLAGEQPSYPPILNRSSTIEDYAEWINRPDMITPSDFTEFYAKIIGFTPEATTAIAWIRHMAPQEVHDHEYEKFLVLEGSCDILIGDEVHHLVPGSMLSIPLHKNHTVTVTSLVPCKVILQRVAA